MHTSERFVRASYVKHGARACAALMLPVLTAWSFSPPQAAASPRPLGGGYTITEIGGLGGKWIFPDDINENGEVVGNDVQHPTDFADTIPFLRTSNGAVIPVGRPEDRAVYATALNDRTQVVGQALDAYGGPYPFVWEDGVLARLGDPTDDDGSANDVNTGGVVVGSSFGDAAVFRDGATIPIQPWPEPPGMDLPAKATAVNSTGQVVGVQGFHAGYRAFLWQDGTISDLPASRFMGAEPLDINDHGQVVGRVWNADWDERAALWHNGTVTLLPARGSDDSAALGINSAGQIVGYGDERALLWHGGQVTDLNRLLPPRSGWLLLQAHAINDRGQIVGWGRRNGVKGRAFLLSPASIPPPFASPADLQGFVWSVHRERRGWSANRIAARFIIRNQGTRRARPSIVQFFLSEDPVLDSSDPQIGKKALPALAGGAARSLRVRLQARGFPAAALPGKRLIARVDSAGAITEGNEANNLAVSAPIR